MQHHTNALADEHFLAKTLENKKLTKTDKIRVLCTFTLKRDRARPRLFQSFRYAVALAKGRIGFRIFVAVKQLPCKFSKTIWL